MERAESNGNELVETDWIRVIRHSILGFVQQLTDATKSRIFTPTYVLFKDDSVLKFVSLFHNGFKRLG